MAKKTTKTRASQYEAILDSMSVKIDDCSILSFKFKSEGQSHSYHYALLNRNLIPLIYDGPAETVRIVLRKNNEDVEKYMSLAEHMEGVYKECKKYNDYE